MAIRVAHNAQMIMCDPEYVVGNLPEGEFFYRGAEYSAREFIVISILSVVRILSGQQFEVIPIKSPPMEMIDRALALTSLRRPNVVELPDEFE